MTPQEIRKRFEHGSPDKYLALFETVREIVTNDTDCDRYKMQKIKVALAAAGAGSDAWGEKHGAAGGLGWLS